MKRLLMLLLAFALCAGLAACGEKKDTTSFYSIQNAKTGTTISLGMSRGEMEDLLGEGTYLEDYQPMYENVSDVTYSYGNEEDFIRIAYRNDSVAGMWKDLLRITSENDGTTSAWKPADSGLSNWCIKEYGLTEGDTIEDVFAHYGETEKNFVETTDQGENLYLLTYCYDSSGNRINDVSSAAYAITFIMEKSKDSILSFSIGSA